MQLPRSRALEPALEWLTETGSTNAVLAERAGRGEAADFAVIATDSQTAGRGRLGRQWTAPPGTSLAVSVLVPVRGIDSERLGWVGLAAGLAMTRAVAQLLPGAEVGLKWPNDVQINGLKAAGLLAEYVPAAEAVVMGAGLNLTMTEEELPVPTATSLSLHGAASEGLLDAALAGYLRQLRALTTALAAGDGEVPDAVRAACTTLGREVRVQLPDGSTLLGRADDIDDGGRLVVRPEDAAAVHVAAGDVEHVRVE